MTLMNAAVQGIGVQILPVAEIFVDGNGDGVDITKYEGWGAFVMDVKPIGGSDPTLALKLQHSDDDGDDDPYVDVPGGAFAVAAGAGDLPYASSTNLFQTKSLNLSSLRGWVRVVKTLGGSDTPDFFGNVVMFGFHKDRSQKDA